MTLPSFAKQQDKSRIPLTLQAVFLASNRGKDVEKPPPNRVADKVYRRNWGVFWKKGERPNSGRRSKRSSSKKKSKQGFFQSLVSGTSTSRSSKKSKRKKGSSKSSSGDENESKSKRKSSKSESKKSKSKSEKKEKSSSASTASKDEPAASAAASDSIMAMLSPQPLLDAMIAARGYSTKTYNTSETAYYNKPTHLQRASYDVYLINLVRQGEVDKFREVMAAGISLNPCNSHGESLVHMLARRGDADMLQILVDLGCSLQVADDYGRTPLHDACWTAQPRFDVVDIILKADRRLLHMTDCRGALPLSYVRKVNWPAWFEFIESKRNDYWPVRDVEKLGPEPDPVLCGRGPNTKPIPDPRNALSPELATMVASGKMQPQELRFLVSDTTASTMDTGMSDSEDDDDDDLYDSDEDSEDYSDSDYDSEYDSDYSDSSDVSIDDEMLAAAQQYQQIKGNLRYSNSNIGAAHADLAGLAAGTSLLTVG